MEIDEMNEGLTEIEQ